ncbi:MULTISPECIES: hypothetical protein [unclassified Streptomyces]|uniref:hypothetical protein n=1 Tax=unclassified Streptomyces TaxID=2593676 RepID=UPI0004BF6AD0|nr:MULTISPECIES: hypothetical protein [unclassified Streptomyces]
MTENAYFANPSALMAGTRQIELISQMANEMFGEFVADVSATAGWPGKSDSYAKQMIPKEKEQREGSIAAGEALVHALVSAGDGTIANTKSVVGTQNGVLDAINDSRINTNNGGSHGGKR